MYGGTNTPEPCSPVDYAHTHPDKLYGGTVAELDLVHVSWVWACDGQVLMMQCPLCGTERNVMPSQVCNTIFHFSVISLFSNVTGSRLSCMPAMLYSFHSSYACLLYLATIMSTFQLVCFVVCTLYL